MTSTGLLATNFGSPSAATITNDCGSASLDPESVRSPVVPGDQVPSSAPSVLDLPGDEDGLGTAFRADLGI